MPVRESSFRIGCGRYIQQKDALAQCGAEIRRLGHAPLIVGGKTALSLTSDTVGESVGAACSSYEFVTHTGTCREDRAKELAALCGEKGYDVIVGVGGGVMMDFAKLCGHFARLPVVNIPTSSATCACYTPLSVRYTPEGKTVGSLHYEREVDCVIADTAVLAGQPVRLLLAGVFDALAKFLEIRHRYRGDGDRVPLGLDYAYVMAEHSFRLLTEKTDAAIAAMREGSITEDLDRVLFSALAATGVISGIARGSNQCALAHKFYEVTRTLFHESARPYLHGEIVGVGLLLQNHFNGEEERNTEIRALMHRYGMPASAADVGILLSPETTEEYWQRLCASSAVDQSDPQQCRRLRCSLEYFMNL